MKNRYSEFIYVYILLLFTLLHEILGLNDGRQRFITIFVAERIASKHQK